MTLVDVLKYKSPASRPEDGSLDAAPWYCPWKVVRLEAADVADDAADVADEAAPVADVAAFVAEVEASDAFVVAVDAEVDASLAFVVVCCRNVSCST